MAFKDSKGRIIEKKSLKYYRQMYQDIMTGYKTALNESKKFAMEASFFTSIYETLEASTNEFLAKFDEAASSDVEFDIDQFYKERMKIMHDALDEKSIAIQVEPMLKDGHTNKAAIEEILQGSTIEEALKSSSEKKSRIADIIAKSNFKANKYFRDAPRVKSSYIDPLKNVFGDNPPVKDSREGLETTMSSFKLTDKPFAGIEKLDDYNPKTDDMKALLSVRKSNSNTYEDQADQMNDAVRDAEFGFISATEISRSTADVLMEKDEVTFGDLFEMFSQVNTLLRLGDDQGGKIRVDDVQAGEIIGIQCTSIPGHLYTMLSKVADHMNEIKQTEDPLLRKSQAIQLASFAYQMAVSEHVFGDGNGRTCRILADTILQTFGLPPHTPNIALINTGATIGNPLNFDNGAKLFMEGTRVSDEIIKLEKYNTIEDMPKRAEEYLESEHMKKDILDTLSPRDAISLAVQSRENKYSFGEALDDFISANHFGTWNSSEYKDVIKAAKAVKKCLESEPINSAKAKEVFKKYHTATEAYEKHCRDNPKDNPTRKAREKALFSMGTAMFYIENTAKRETRLEAKAVLNNVTNLKNNILSEMRTGDARECLAKFVIARQVEKEMMKNEPKYTIDEAEKMLKMDSKSVAAFAKDKLLLVAASKAATEGVLKDKNPLEQLECIADKFENLKEAEAAQKARQEAMEKANKEKKAQGPAVGK